MNATETARQQLEKRKTREEAPTLIDLVKRQQPAIERTLAGIIDADRFTRIMLTEIRRTPKLLECDPASVLGALMQSAQLMLEPGPLGHVYLVPFGRECQFILGYKGMIELARRSDRLGLIRAATVYEGDEFDYEETERGPRLHHRECAPKDRGEIRCDYAVATVRVGPRVLVPHVRRCWPEEIAAARARSASAKRNQGPWITDEITMRHKTCIRRLAPMLPMTTLFARALEVDERAIVWDGSEIAAPENEEASDGS